MKETELSNSMTDDFTHFMNDVQLYILRNEKKLTKTRELSNLLQQLAKKLNFISKLDVLKTFLDNWNRETNESAQMLE